MWCVWKSVDVTRITTTWDLSLFFEGVMWQIGASKRLTGWNLFLMLFFSCLELTRFLFLVFVCFCLRAPAPGTDSGRAAMSRTTENLPTNIIPTKMAWLKLSGKSPMALGIPPLNFKILLESNPLKSIMLVRILAVRSGFTGLTQSGSYLSRGEASP